MPYKIAECFNPPFVVSLSSKTLVSYITGANTARVECFLSTLPKELYDTTLATTAVSRQIIALNRHLNTGERL